MVKQKRSDEAEKVLRVIILRLEKLLNARPVSSAGVTQASVTTEKVLGRKEDRLCCDGTIVVGKLLKVFSCVPMSIPLTFSTPCKEHQYDSCQTSINVRRIEYSCTRHDIYY